MATCLVTGGAGFLGSHLCDALIARGHRVLCVDNYETGSLRNIEHLKAGDSFRALNVDITDAFFVDEPVDFVYHLASPASPIDYLRLPLHTLKVGSHGTHHALGLAKEKRARFLIASTSEVYGDPKEHPQVETYWGHVNPIGPRGVYDEAKRYAEALTMAYHRQQGLDTAIMRIFNSIHPDEQVLYDDGRELRRETVREMAARHARFAVAAGYVPKRQPQASGVGLLDAGFSPAMEYPLSFTTVPGFDADGQIEPREARALIAHPTDERCFEVKTRYGRSVRVTGHHSVFAEGEDGEPVATPVVDLTPGDRIAIARKINVPERDRRLLSMIEVWRSADRDPFDLHVQAPGLGALAWEKRFDLHACLTTHHRGNGPNWRNTAWTALIRMRESDRLPLPLVWRLGLDDFPSDARVSMRVPGGSSSMPAVIDLSDDLLWLLGLFVADGCWQEGGKNAYITISCEDALLDRATAIIEREFGLDVGRQAASDARAGSIAIKSGLLLALLSFLGFPGGRKRIPGWILGLPLARLKWFLEGYREGDGVHSGTKFDAAIHHEFSTVHDELKDDLVVAFGRFGLVPSVGRGDPYWRLELSHVSPWSPLAWDAGVTQRLNARVRGDLVWAAITEINEIPTPELVYDFSVPGVENFLAGTGVMCANTYGSRMRAHDGRAIPTFFRQALQDLPITVFGDGSQTRSFCYVSDLIRGMIALAESGEHFPVNIGNPDEFTLLELAHTIIEVTGSKSELIYEPLPTDDPQQRRPDITRATELLGWAPEVSLRDGLQRTIDEAGVELLIGGTGR